MPTNSNKPSQKIFPAKRSILDQINRGKNMINFFPKGGGVFKDETFPKFQTFPKFRGGGGGLEIWEVFPKNTASLILTASLRVSAGF